MNRYSVHFSLYSEQYGAFDEAEIRVEAVDQFEARRLAWDASDEHRDMQFASCVKVCGVTWDASPLDVQDYFNAAASYEKYKLRYIENVDAPNGKIKDSDYEIEACKRGTAEHYGALWAISQVAGDFGRHHGILPPAIFEELHYAREFLDLIEPYDFEKYNTFLNVIERAEKWDSSAMFNIRELFGHGYLSIGGHEYSFSSQFKRGGIYQACADPADYDSMYIHRWTNAREYKSMGSLPFFGGKDIIANSQSLQYSWQTLVLGKEALPLEKQAPENCLWLANQYSEADYDIDGSRAIYAENLITGEVAQWKRTDFLGVLRPEKAEKIDYEAIKAERAAVSAIQRAQPASGTSAELKKAAGSEKPSIIDLLRETETEIRENRAQAAPAQKQHYAHGESSAGLG